MLVPRHGSQTEVAGLLLRALGLGAPWSEPCSEKGLAPAFVATRAFKDYPVDDYLSAAVTSEECLHIEISERSTGTVVHRDSRRSDGSECDVVAAVSRMFSCIRNAVGNEGGPGQGAAKRRTPAVRPQGPEVERLRALGYAE